MSEISELNEAMLPPGYLVSNRYEIVRYVAGGATGSVFLAIDRLLEDTTVAIKVLRMTGGHTQDHVKRFLREVKLMNSVNHRNVVRTFDAGNDKDLIYFTMEYIRGVSLERMIEQQELDFETLESFLLQICLGLEAIHGAGIVHRDLKPGNILVDTESTVKIADFGVARPFRSSLTQNGSILGSFDYMAPEIWEGLELTSAVDFYSLGVVLYEVIVGRLPFYADSPAQIMRLHLNELPEPPRQFRPEVPEWMNRLTLRLLEKDPKRRPRSAREIINYIMTVTRGSHEDDLVDVMNLDGESGEVVRSSLPENTVVERDAPGEPSDSTGEADIIESSDDALSGIIFKSFPTSEEIVEHERRMSETGRHPKILDEDEDRKSAQAIRRLERLIKWVSIAIMVVMISLLGTVVYQYGQTDSISISWQRQQTYANSGYRAPNENPFRDLSVVGSFVSDLRGRFLEGVTPAQPSRPLDVGGSSAGGSGGGAPSSGSTSHFDRIFSNTQAPSAVPQGYASGYSSPDRKAGGSAGGSNFWKWDFGDGVSKEISTFSSYTPSTGIIVKPPPPPEAPPAPMEAPPVSRGAAKPPVDSLIPSGGGIRALSLQSNFSIQQSAEKYRGVSDLLKSRESIDPSVLQAAAALLSDPEKLDVVAQKAKLRAALERVEFLLTGRSRSAADLEKISARNEARSEQVEAALEDLSDALPDETRRYGEWLSVMELEDANDLGRAASALEGFSPEIKGLREEYDRASAVYADRSADRGDGRGAADENVKKLGENLQSRRAELKQQLHRTIQKGLIEQMQRVLDLAAAVDRLEQELSRLNRQTEYAREMSSEVASKSELTKEADTLRSSLAALEGRVTVRQELAIRIGRLLQGK